MTTFSSSDHEELSKDDDSVAEQDGETPEESTHEQLLRALAENENIRKRAKKDCDEAHRFAISAFAKDLLGISDDLDRALGNLQNKDTTPPTIDSLLEGVQMIRQELGKVFERYSVCPVPALGEKFNPHIHQAMLEIPHKEKPVGTVIQVLQEGYQLHDRLLRPALVAVVKADSNPSPEEDPS